MHALHRSLHSVSNPKGLMFVVADNSEIRKKKEKRVHSSATLNKPDQRKLARHARREETSGYLSIIAYVHFYKPGSLILQTGIFKIRVEVWDKFEESPLDTELPSRRWLQSGETPYPGYCRAPGSGVCLPVLCNCAKLTEIWQNMKQLNKIN